MNKKITTENILRNVFNKVTKPFSQGAFSLFLGIILLTTNPLSAQSGKDGALTVTAANTVLSRYTRTTADILAGATTITVNNIAELNRDSLGYINSPFVTNNSVYFSNTLSNGDLIMIYQAQGATINTTNTISYGVTAMNGAGTYELARVLSVAGNVITLSCATKQGYNSAGFVQIIRIPQYTTLTINLGASVVAIDWGSPAFGGGEPSRSGKAPRWVQRIFCR